jgi:tripartite-type tricarboxylate transporter receptor subunit TctC
MSKRPMVLLVHPSLPFKTPADFLAFAKANPGKLNFSTPGMGGSPHLNAEWLSSITDTKLTFVHYKGAAPQFVDFLAGRTDVGFATMATALPLIRSGKLRPIGYASMVTSKLLPDVQVIGAQAAPGLDYTSWLGFAAPGSMQPALLTRIHGELLKVARTPDVVQKFENEGILPVAMPPQESRQFVAAETARWRKLVQERGISFEE